jgi:predicted nucleic acid-binding protein
MPVVSDTSPLRYFIATGCVDLLRQVLGSVTVPVPVLAELTHPSAPLIVRNWCRVLPAWISIRDIVQPLDRELAESLDPGEAAAIQLAIEIKADLLLIDERLGRREATLRQVPVIGALGVLKQGFSRGLIVDPMAAVTAMRSDGFRVSRQLLGEFQETVATIKRSRITPR